MSIAGGLFNSHHKEEKGGDSRTTADGDATAVAAAPVDLTTSLPGFDDDPGEGLVIETTGAVRGVEGDADAVGNVDVEGVTGAAEGDFDFDVDATAERRLDPES